MVEAVGAGVTSFEVGDDVFGFGEDGRRLGAHAEYVSFPEDGAIATMPSGVTYEEAAPSTEGAHYALSAIRKAKIGDGHDVLVNGATGAIGSAAVQILKSLGATVTATSDTEHVELVQRPRGRPGHRLHGRGLHARAGDVRRGPGRGRQELVRSMQASAATPGIYLSSDLGPLSQNPLLALITPLFGGKKVMFPIPPNHGREEMVGTSRR